MPHAHRLLVSVLSLVLAGSPVLAKGRRAQPQSSGRLSAAVFDAAISAGFDPGPLRRLLRSVTNPNAVDQRGISALAYAVMSGDAELVRSMLRRGGDPNRASGAGRRCPLHTVNYYRDDALPIVQELLRGGAKVDARDGDGNTPLMLALEAPHYQAAMALLARGADVNARNQAGETPLYAVARTDAPDLVRALLRRGARLNVTSKDGSTPLGRAVVVGSSVTVALMLEKGARINWNEGQSVPLLHSAVTSGSPSIIRALLKRGADLSIRDGEGNPLLLTAVSGGSIEAVELLLTQGVDVNATAKDGRTALMEAAQRGTPELVGLLLKKGADARLKSKEGWNAVWYAKHQLLGVDQETIRLLKAAGAEDQGLPLREAIELGLPDDVRAALARGEDPNQKAPPSGMVGLLSTFMKRAAMAKGGEQVKEEDSKKFEALLTEGSPLIFLAVGNGHENPEIVKALLEAGARADATDPFGSTLLHSAAMTSDAEVIDLLLKHGAPLEARDGDGNTALLAATIARNVPAVRKLLERGADKKATNTAGFSAVHLVLMPTGPNELILADLLRALLEGGVDPNLPGPRGISPLMLLALRPGFLTEDEGAPSEEPPPAGASDAEKITAAVRNQSRQMVKEAVQGKVDGKPIEESGLAKAAEKFVEKLPDKAQEKFAELGAKLAEALSAERFTPSQALEEILKRGADPNARGEQGLTVTAALLHQSTAARRPVTALLKLLLKHGMKLEQPGPSDLAPLAQAAAQGDAALVNTLLHLGADPNGAAGVPPLHAAAASGNPEAARLLLLRGAARDPVYKGVTPLFIAATEGHVEMIRLLLKHGASPNKPSTDGITPLRAAANSHRNAAVTVLKQAGARK